MKLITVNKACIELHLLFKQNQFPTSPPPPFPPWGWSSTSVITLKKKGYSDVKLEDRSVSSCPNKNWGGGAITFKTISEYSFTFEPGQSDRANLRPRAF